MLFGWRFLSGVAGALCWVLFIRYSLTFSSPALVDVPLSAPTVIECPSLSSESFGSRARRGRGRGHGRGYPLGGSRFVFLGKKRPLPLSFNGVPYSRPPKKPTLGGLADLSWRRLFPQVEVHNIPSAYSDHCVLLLTLSPPAPAETSSCLSQFKFEASWQRYAECAEIISDAWLCGQLGGSRFAVVDCLAQCSEALSLWSNS
ncbi:hypothetical protein Salat_1884500 [Sesamum alatum]|uniref:Endonuclease/exonuclease/phosphatase domain-containing protein n=1 Tax=Sesamum alatum TaxID=300844 RepID=A0AAE2CIA6_9LAMI|nr:hypothetical protein Salat_1884500 [Sesamum alatum]